MTEQLIKVPDIGGAEGAEVVEVLVAVGDHLALEQSVIVVDSAFRVEKRPSESGHSPRGSNYQRPPY